LFSLRSPSANVPEIHWFFSVAGFAGSLTGRIRSGRRRDYGARNPSIRRCSVQS
jgi:hypothetical protein